MKTYPMDEARAEFSKLVEKALAGEPQRVTRCGKVAVVIVSEQDWQARSRSAPTLGHLQRNLQKPDNPARTLPIAHRKSGRLASISSEAERAFDVSARHQHRLHTRRAASGARA
jgi:prevent-host-death family protein